MLRRHVVPARILAARSRWAGHPQPVAADLQCGARGRAPAPLRARRAALRGRGPAGHGRRAVLPHEVEVVHGQDGRPRLQALHEEHRLAASCMQRVSFLLAEGKVATEETVAACPHLAPDQVRSLINKQGKALCHVDPRDAGTEAQLLGGAAAAAAGVKIVACVTADEPDVEFAAFMQTVVVIYSGCSEQEALAIVGLTSDELSAIFNRVWPQIVVLTKACLDGAENRGLSAGHCVSPRH